MTSTTVGILDLLTGVELKKSLVLMEKAAQERDYKMSSVLTK